ncbi:ArsR/SmtB family transcription factor [Rathayibacter rathayi]|uniref:ArsR/SmtB family transcription factor n=1 Tax=Rathayibacter rathayi TaxID=33887 RepID=UPI0015E397D0|nr:helix-turn-helix domain-containing protein [Rathayibacter rathayi]
MTLSRLRIIGLLAASGPASCAELARRLDVSASSVQGNLAKLADARVLRRWTPAGARSAVYAVNQDTMRRLLAGAYVELLGASAA